MAILFVYDSAGFLNGVHEGDSIIANSTALPPPVADGYTPRFVNGGWVHDGLNLSPTPPEFLLMLTLQERVAIRAARATDLVVDDLLQMIEDPRLTFVELTNPSVIEAVNYLVTTDPPLLTADRAASVLSGLSAAP